MSVKEEFIDECIKNRKYLGFSHLDMANCLINMSENDYKNFELGKYNISKENVSRLIKVLCIEKPIKQENILELSSDLSEEEREDLLNLASELVGEFND